MSTHFWRRGTKTRRTLYRDERLVGQVDTPELADEIIHAMRAAHAIDKIQEVFNYTPPEGRIAKIAAIINDLPYPPEMELGGGEIHTSSTTPVGGGLAFDDPRSHPAVLRMMARRLDELTDHKIRADHFESEVRAQREIRDGEWREQIARETPPADKAGL